jgi:hypothetical protein
MEKAFMETENVYVVLPSPGREQKTCTTNFLQCRIIFFIVQPLKMYCLEWRPIAHLVSIENWAFVRSRRLD